MSSMIKKLFEEHGIQVIEIDGESWFVASDIAKVIGLKRVATILAKIDDKDKRVININADTLVDGKKLGAAIRSIVSVSGAISLLGRSTKPAAIKLRDWALKTTLRESASTSIPALSSRKVVERRKMYGFERMRLTEALESVCCTLPPSLRTPIMRWVWPDIRIFAGGVRAGEPLLIRNTGDVDNLIMMINVAVEEYKSRIPLLIEKKLRKADASFVLTAVKALPAPVQPEEKPTFKSNKTSAKFSHQIDPSVSGAEFGDGHVTLGTLEFSIPAGMYAPSEIETSLSRWAGRAGLSLPKSNFGRVSSDLGMKSGIGHWREHVKEARVDIEAVELQTQVFKYSAVACAAVIEDAYRQNWLKGLSNQSSLPGMA